MQGEMEFSSFLSRDRKTSHLYHMIYIIIINIIIIIILLRIWIKIYLWNFGIEILLKFIVKIYGNIIYFVYKKVVKSYCLIVVVKNF